MHQDTNERLTALRNFGTDPGSLSADIYVPKNSLRVVVLNGKPNRRIAMISDRVGRLLLTIAGCAPFFRAKTYQ